MAACNSTMCMLNLLKGFLLQYNPYLNKMGLRFACLCPAFTATDILNPMGTLYPNDAKKFIQMLGINE